MLLISTLNSHYP